MRIYIFHTRIYVQLPKHIPKEEKKLMFNNRKRYNRLRRFNAVYKIIAIEIGMK